MNKKVIFMLVSFMALAPAVVCSAQQKIKLTTYYPAPFGAYKQLAVGPGVIQPDSDIDTNKTLIRIGVTEILHAEEQKYVPALLEVGGVLIVPNEMPNIPAVFGLYSKGDGGVFGFGGMVGVVGDGGDVGVVGRGINKGIHGDNFYQQDPNGNWPNAADRTCGVYGFFSGGHEFATLCEYYGVRGEAVIDVEHDKKGTGIGVLGEGPDYGVFGRGGLTGGRFEGNNLGIRGSNRYEYTDGSWPDSDDETCGVLGYFQGGHNTEQDYEYYGVRGIAIVDYTKNKKGVGIGVHGQGSTYGVYGDGYLAGGYFKGNTNGVYAEASGAASSYGVRAKAKGEDSYAVYGEALENARFGVYGKCITDDGTGTYGHFGSIGGSGNGVSGEGRYWGGSFPSKLCGVYGKITQSNGSILEGGTGYAIYGEGGKYAGYFKGDVQITGKLNGKVIEADGKYFVIDHPLKKNMLLRHACLEGPEAGIYQRGRIRLKDKEAIIELPDYFKALSKDPPTVCLTPVNELALVSYQEMEQSKKYKIISNKDEIEVDWLIIGKRGDIVVEEKADF